MSKVVDSVVDTGGDLFGLARGLFDKTIGALWDSLSPDEPENDLATLSKGLQKGIDQPRRVTFGVDRVGGVIAHQAETERDGKKYLQLIVLISGAPIDSLDEIYIANKPITDYPAQSWDYSLSDGYHTTANAKAVAKMAGWTSEHIGLEQAHVFLELENNRETFPDGISDCEFLIKGARVWDPRDNTQNADDKSTWKFSQNAVLCALHYVRFYGAHPVPLARLALNWWIAAINVCDESVPYTDDSNATHHEPRYTCNGTFQFTNKPLAILNQLERCFAGKIFRQMGQWFVRIGAWYGEPTYTVTADDIHGNIKIKWHADLRDRANVMRATFVDAEQNYERTDAPPVIATGYQEKDGQLLEKSISLPFVRSVTTAQRLATIALEQTRLGSIELPLKHKGLAAAVGRTIYVNLPHEKIENKIYRVVERRFRIDAGVTLLCVEDAPELYSEDTIAGKYDLTPNSSYIAGDPPPITDASVTLTDTDTVELTFKHPTADSVEFDISVFAAENVLPVYKTTAQFTKVVLPDMAIGEYEVHIRAKNIFGRASAAVSLIFSIDTPANPIVELVKATHNQIMLSANIVGMSIATSFEFQFLGTQEQPIEPAIARTQLFMQIGLVPETEYKFRCRAVNKIGNSEWVNFSATTTERDKVSRGDLETDITDILDRVNSLDLPDNITELINNSIINNIEQNTVLEEVLRSLEQISANDIANLAEHGLVELKQLHTEIVSDKGKAKAELSLVAIAEEEQNRALAVNQLESTFNNTTATINNQLSTVASDVSAQASSISAMNASIDNISVNYAQKNYVTASVDSAEAGILTTIDARFDQNVGTYGVIIKSAVDAANAATSAATNLAAGIYDNNGNLSQAFINDVALVAVQADGQTIAAAIAAYTVSAGGSTYSIEQIAQASVDASGNNFAAQWGVKTNINDVSHGIGFHVKNGKTYFVASVNNFAVYDPATGDLDTLPFFIDDGVTYIDDARIKELSADKIRGELVHGSTVSPIYNSAFYQSTPPFEFLSFNVEAETNFNRIIEISNIVAFIYSFYNAKPKNQGMSLSITATATTANSSFSTSATTTYTVTHLNAYTACPLLVLDVPSGDQPLRISVNCRPIHAWGESGDASSEIGAFFTRTRSVVVKVMKRSSVIY